MDVPAAQAMMIDDSPYNLAGAATVGMQTFLYEANALEKLRRRLAE
jgi:FMN phosphatase YigB (HAD superfamily)